MASGAALKANLRAKILIGGWPGSAKTGSIAALANAGFKIRMLDYEGNYKSLLQFTDPKFLKNIDILTFQDKLVDNGNFLAPDGVPTAFTDSLKAMMEWKSTDDKGNVVSLGKSKEWGPDTVVVVDSMTSQGEAAFRRARKMMNKTPRDTTQAVWGAAVDDQLNMIKAMGAEKNQFHLIVLAHLALIGPETIVENTKRDADQEVTEHNKEIALQKGELMDVRVYPRAVTKNASMTIAKEFDTFLLAKKEKSPLKDKYVLQTSVGEFMDLKVPAEVKKTYPVETGLLDIFDALGIKRP